MGSNHLRDEGTIAVCNALEQSKVSKLEELHIYNNDIGANGAKAVAAFCTVSASLTSLNISSNRLCGVWNEFVNDYNAEEETMGTYTSEGIQAVADALRVSASLTNLS